MILTGTEIQKEVYNGNITLKPFNKDALNPNSYNYRLGPKLLVIDNEILDAKKETKYKEVTIGQEGFWLEPNKLYLGSTLEEIGSREYVVSLIGRSSIGRLGLFLQITADLGHIGTSHNWTLELHVVQPLKVYSGMRIGQVSFWVPEGDKSKVYTLQNKYKSYSEPHISKIYEEII